MFVCRNVTWIYFRKGVEECKKHNEKTHKNKELFENDSMDEKQRSQPAVSGNEASGAEDSMEEAEQDQEETLIEKQKSPSLEKMKTKGQR